MGLQPLVLALFQCRLVSISRFGRQYLAFMKMFLNLISVYITLSPSNKENVCFANQTGGEGPRAEI